MSDIIDWLSGEDKAKVFERGRHEGDQERKSAILANMLKNGIQTEQTAEFASVSPDKIASMKQGKGHSSDVRKNLEESMRAHDDLYRELAAEGLPDGQRRPAHP